MLGEEASVLSSWAARWRQSLQAFGLKPSRLAEGHGWLPARRYPGFGTAGRSLALHVAPLCDVSRRGPGVSAISKADHSVVDSSDDAASHISTRERIYHAN